MSHFIAFSQFWRKDFRSESFGLIYILMCHGNNFEEAVVRAVNDTKDNDTIAAIVRAVIGALHGKAAIPPRWIDNLSGRTTDSDDGRVFELIREARNRFWGGKGG